MWVLIASVPDLCIIFTSVGICKDKIFSFCTAMFNTHTIYYTIMDFSAGVHDVICTRKNKIDRGGSRGQYIFFWCISHHVHQLNRP